MNGNTVHIVGNVTRDPELRFTASGLAVASFGVAVNRVWNDKQTNEKKETVSFFDVSCWQDLAENASESLTKGARVIVTGRLEQRTWETQEGEKRSKVEIIADEIGPSLRWATAQVVRNDKRGPAPEQGDYGNPVQPKAKAKATAGAAAGGGQPAYDYGDEPF